MSSDRKLIVGFNCNTVEYGSAMWRGIHPRYCGKGEKTVAWLWGRHPQDRQTIFIQLWYGTVAKWRGAVWLISREYTIQKCVKCNLPIYCVAHAIEQYVSSLKHKYSQSRFFLRRGTSFEINRYYCLPYAQVSHRVSCRCTSRRSRPPTTVACSDRSISCSSPSPFSSHRWARAGMSTESDIGLLKLITSDLWAISAIFDRFYSETILLVARPSLVLFAGEEGCHLEDWGYNQDSRVGGQWNDNATRCCLIV